MTKTEDGEHLVGQKWQMVIRRNSDGATKTHSFDDLKWNEGTLFWITDGSMGCDCNFAEFFGDNSECGVARYSLLRVEFPDGTYLPVEEEPTNG